MTTLLGPVVRLQVQRSPLKAAPPPGSPRRYDPAAVTAVEVLHVDPLGAAGELAGERVADVHHPAHPLTRNRGGVNGLSLMTTGGYARLRARYGPHLVDGVAGESVLVESDEVLGPALLGARLVVGTVDGPVELTDLVLADPCLPFARFCLDVEPGTLPREEEQAALESLGHGARGVYATASTTGTLRPGDPVRVVQP